MILKPISGVNKFVESGEKGSVIGITLFLTIMQGLLRVRNVNQVISNLEKIVIDLVQEITTFNNVEKCITINIVDFKCIEINKLHTSFRITEDATNYKLTDVLEIHYLELPKLFDDNVPKDEDKPLVQWMMFLQSKNKEAFEMLAEKNEKIRKAYNILEIISKDDKARAAYEAREAELHDQNTRLKSAREEGSKEAKKENAKNFLLMGLDVDIVAKGTGLTVEKVEKIKNELN